MSFKGRRFKRLMYGFVAVLSLLGLTFLGVSGASAANANPNKSPVASGSESTPTSSPSASTHSSESSNQDAKKGVDEGKGDDKSHPMPSSTPTATSSGSSEDHGKGGDNGQTNLGALWSVPSNSVTAPFKEPQHLITVIPTLATNYTSSEGQALLAKFVSFEQCGKVYQTDLYKNDAATAALLKKGVLVFAGEDSQDLVTSSSYHFIVTSPCQKPTPTPTTTPSPTVPPTAVFPPLGQLKHDADVELWCVKNAPQGKAIFTDTSTFDYIVRVNYNGDTSNSQTIKPGHSAVFSLELKGTSIESGMVTFQYGTLSDGEPVWAGSVTKSFKGIVCCPPKPSTSPTPTPGPTTSPSPTSTPKPTTQPVPTSKPTSAPPVETSPKPSTTPTTPVTGTSPSSTAAPVAAQAGGTPPSSGTGVSNNAPSVKTLAFTGSNIIVPAIIVVGLAALTLIIFAMIQLVGTVRRRRMGNM